MRSIVLQKSVSQGPHLQNGDKNPALNLSQGCDKVKIEYFVKNALQEVKCYTNLREFN